MPTIIALDVSLSMQRLIPGRSDDNAMSYHQLAVKGINQFLEHLANNSKLEFVSYVTYSTEFELRVDFTRDYDQIRQAVKKQIHFDSSSMETMLKGVNDMLSSNWGAQNLCQVVVFTDCGIGLGTNALSYITRNIATQKPALPYPWMTGLASTKLNIICMGLNSEYYFTKALQTYQNFLDASGLKGVLFQPKLIEQPSAFAQEDTRNNVRKSELGRTTMYEMVERLCESSYKSFETILKCGGYFRMECPILIWPPPTLCNWNNNLTTDQSLILSNSISICGYVGLSDIGSPASLSRHLIVPKMEREKPSKRSSDKPSKNSKPEPSSSLNEFEKLETDIRSFYFKADGDGEEDSVRSSVQSDTQKESICVLLHGALKVENMAAVVLLADNWYGFIYTFADSKKKSNLMLNILPKGSNVIPWLGDLRMFGMMDDFIVSESSTFPVKSEKRSYSQNFVIWIKHSSLHSDIQKVLRHAKKIPEKTQHFYKELNRIRRAALSIGFIELMEILANIFEKELAALPNTLNPECVHQLKHSAIELRKTASRDLKNAINPATSELNP